MKRLPSSRLGAVTSTTRQNIHRTLTPLRALPKFRMCEDVYPGGFRSTLAGRIYPAPKVIPFPGTEIPTTIEATVDHALRDFSARPSLCGMLFFAPPAGYFAAFGSLHRNPEPKEIA